MEVIEIREPGAPLSGVSMRPGRTIGVGVNGVVLGSSNRAVPVRLLLCPVAVTTTMPLKPVGTVSVAESTPLESTVAVPNATPPMVMATVSPGR